MSHKICDYHCARPYLELLGLLDSDLQLCVLAEAGSAQQSDLLLLRQVLGLLGVQDRVVNTLCGENILARENNITINNKERVYIYRHMKNYIYQN